MAVLILGDRIHLLGVGGNRTITKSAIRVIIKKELKNVNKDKGRCSGNSLVELRQHSGLVYQ